MKARHLIVAVGLVTAVFQAAWCRAQMFDPSIYYGTDSEMGVGYCDPATMGIVGPPAGAYGDPNAAGAGWNGPLDNQGCRPALIWGRADYLWMWTRERDLPPLITTSPAGTPLVDAGVLGVAGTEILLGNDRVDAGSQPGYLLESGIWFSRSQGLGVGARYMRIDDELAGASLTSTGDPILARPFFDTSSNAEGSLIVAYPGISEGTVTAGSELSLEMADGFLRHLLYAANGNRVDLIGGYQWGVLEDRAFAQHNLTSLDPNGRVPVGTTIATVDNFLLENQFNGGSVGLITECEDGRWLWRALTKVAFGNVNQVATITGTTVTTVPNGGSAQSNQGLLALPTNIGQYERDQFAIIPELHVAATFRVNCSLGVSIGYSLVYWTDAVLGASAIDTTINTTQLDGTLVGDARPEFPGFDDTQFWAQGITAGIDWRF
jgi:hypothetical protein